MGCVRVWPGVAEGWSSWDVEVAFATMGRRVLARYPANWRVYGTVDRQDMLSGADVFVMHGGSNSLPEAIQSQVPMVIAAFFGDRMLIGRWVRERGIGVVLPVPGTTDRDTMKDHLNDGLAEQMDKGMRRILADDRYRRSYDTRPAGCDTTAARTRTIVERYG